MAAGLPAFTPDSVRVSECVCLFFGKEEGGERNLALKHGRKGE